MAALNYSSEVLRLLNEPVPRLRKIRHCLEEITARQLSQLLRANPEYVSVLDRFFRLFDQSCGARLISHRDFDPDLRLEMFYCQVVRTLGNHLNASDYEILHSYELDTYWQQVSSLNLVRIFERLASMPGDSNRYAALMLFQNLSLEDLEQVQSESLHAVLDFLKTRDWDFKELIHANLDLYDYVARLARDLGDTEFTSRLDQFMGFAVRARIAEDFADDIRAARDTDGAVSLGKLVPIVERVPRDSVEATLERVVRDGTVDRGVAGDLLRLLHERGTNHQTAVDSPNERA